MDALDYRFLHVPLLLALWERCLCIRSKWLSRLFSGWIKIVHRWAGPHEDVDGAVRIVCRDADIRIDGYPVVMRKREVVVYDDMSAYVIRGHVGVYFLSADGKVRIEVVTPDEGGPVRTGSGDEPLETEIGEQVEDVVAYAPL